MQEMNLPLNCDCRKKRYRDGMSSCECFVKRSFDLVAAFLGLIVLSPILVLLYVAIWLQDHHDPIFRQERVGYKGKSFVLYKFRTMVINAEEQGIPKLCETNDSRLTKLGAFLRVHHLDELPQLWNVLMGEMSFVGPRPERKYFVDQIKAINPDYRLLFRLRPGLFSMATLYNGYTNNMEKMLERLRMDLDYLKNRSLWLDLKVIFCTVYAILSGKRF